MKVKQKETTKQTDDLSLQHITARYRYRIFCLAANLNFLISSRISFGRSAPAFSLRNVEHLVEVETSYQPISSHIFKMIFINIEQYYRTIFGSHPTRATHQRTLGCWPGWGEHGVMQEDDDIGRGTSSRSPGFVCIVYWRRILAYPGISTACSCYKFLQANYGLWISPEALGLLGGVLEVLQGANFDWTFPSVGSVTNTRL